jgi:glycosyltransferase involved in cell wall biosynthesis
MRIAIVCDWLVTQGGAEKVLKEMFACFPQADLFSVVDFLQNNQRDFILNKIAKTTFIQALPFAKKKYRSYLPLMPLAIEQLDLSPYDLVISSSHAVAKGIIPNPNQLHISYIHSPMRYVWDLQHQYLRETGLDKKWLGYVARYFLHKLRAWDFRTAQGVDHLIANSNFIAKRIAKIYRRESTVIYPPIDTEKFSLQENKADFYLTAARLVPYKKIDLIIEAFAHLPDKKLLVIGDGPEFAKLKRKTKENVTLLGYQRDEVLINHLQRAKAFIFAAEEDFGLLPLEAQACGTPVIAYGKGGALETVNDFKNHPEPTGIFFDKQESSSLIDAIHLFEKHASCFQPVLCMKNAKRFSIEHFHHHLKSYVQQKYADFISREQTTKL